MPKRFDIAKQFGGLDTLHDPADVYRKGASETRNRLSKAQNISIDKRGIIRTIGGLETHGEVPTQAAIIAPGSGLFTYGSDHWRGGTDTVVDVLSQLNAASDHDADNDGPDATTGWDDTTITLTSVADTDSGAIVSNGTSYIMKGVFTGTAPVVSQSVTTVVGQRYRFHIDAYNVDADYIYIYTVPTVGSGFVGSGLNETKGSWIELNVEFVAVTTTTSVRIVSEGDVDDTIYFDDAYLTELPRRDIDTNWLALADVANAQVDLYNSNDDSFAASLLDFGTVSAFVGSTAGNIDFPTDNTITDSASEFLKGGVMAGDIRKISGCSTTTANNILFVVDRVIAGTIYARGSPFTVTAAEAGTVTLTKYNPTAFHYVNEALRVSPVGGGIALRPKHYSFVDRYHLKGSGSSENQYQNWYANDVGPVKPTDVAFDADVDDGVSGDLTAGAGWELGGTRTADDGDWPAGTYIIACSHIYDDGQESALYVPSTDVVMDFGGGTYVSEGDSLTLCAKATGPYDERISGGRVYCRLDETDDPWILLLDISMSEGARTTLSGTWNAWAKGATADTAYTASFKSVAPNADSYESLSEIDSGTKIEAFNENDRFWNTSVIARNRCFIGSVRYDDEGGKTSHYRDRILYSKVGLYDSFPIDNYIDVVQGDAEDYVKLGAYGNDLLCYKASTLYIIDISDPDPAGWQMKQDANKGKYPFRGIRHPGAYFETPYGPAWCNEFGVFLYDGNEIVELLKDKIELSEHPLARRRYYELATDDVITVADDADLDFGTGDGAIEVLLYMDSVAADVFFYNRYQNGDNQIAFYYTQSTGKLSALVKAGATTMQYALASWAPTAKTWYHLIWTFVNGTSNALYINGVSQTLTTDTKTGGDISIAADLEFGKRASTYYDIFMAQCRQYSDNITAAEALRLYNGGVPANTPTLDLSPSGIADALWTDDSGNTAGGVVTGATPIYEDSWSKFYTDYSILGYHAKTNQIIVMRDCTGKWSSGQDHGDCMIIDIDTGDITTGRRFSAILLG